MPRVPDAAIGQLAFNPHFEELGFQEIAQPDRELGDGQNLSSRRAAGDLTVVGSWPHISVLRTLARLPTIFFFERQIEQVRHDQCAGSIQIVDCRLETPRSFRSCTPRLSRSMSVARPVAGSLSTMTAFSRGFAVAVSKRAGNAFRNRPSAGSISTPMTESCGPVMPTSVR